MPYAVNKGVKTYYEVTGEGPDFLMLHANPCDHRMWMYQIAYFSRRFRVIATDMRGYGRTDKPRGLEHYAIERLVEDVAALIDASAGNSTTGSALVGASAAEALPGSALVVMPCPIQSLSTYSAGVPCALPPR